MVDVRTRYALTARRAFLVLSLSLLTILYYEFIRYLQPPQWGGDFDIFYAATSVFSRHGNPYDLAQLFARELLLFHPGANWRAALAGEPYPQSPLLLVLLWPLLALSPEAAYLVTAFVIGLSILATLLLLNHLYPVANAFPRICLLTVSPAGLLGLHSGQVDAVLMVALVAALWAMRSGRFEVAGVLIALCLIKPNIFLVPFLLLWLLASSEGGGRRFGIGLTVSFVIALACWIGQPAF